MGEFDIISIGKKPIEDKQPPPSNGDSFDIVSIGGVATEQATRPTLEVPKWAERYPDIFKVVHETFKGTAELGGLAKGGALGVARGARFGPTGALIGGVVGAGMGFAGARGATRTVDELFDLSEPPKNITETLKRTGEDIKTGAEIEMIGGIVAKGIDLVSRPFLRTFNAIAPNKMKWFLGTETQVQTETRKLLQIFKKYGTQPLPSEVVPKLQKTLSVIEGALGYTPIAGDVMFNNSAMRLAHMNAIRDRLIARNAPMKQIEAIGIDIRREAKEILSTQTALRGAKLEALVDDFMGRFGSLSRQGAGLKMGEIMGADRTSRQLAIREGFENIRTNLLPQGGQDIVPLSESMISAVEDVLRVERAKSRGLKDNELIKLLEDYLPQDLPPDILKTMPSNYKALAEGGNKDIQSIIEMYKPEKTWEGLQADRSELLSRIRGIIKAEGRETPTSRVYEILQKNILDSMGEYAEGIGGDLWKEYKMVRGQVSEMYDLYDKDILKIMQKSPEDILDGILKGKAGITQLQQIKRAVGEEGLIPLRQGFFRQIIDKASINKDNVLNPVQLRTLLRRSGDVAKELMTSEQHRMLSKIAEEGIRINKKTTGMKTIQFLEILSKSSPNELMNFLIKPNNSQNVRLAKRLLSPTRLKDLKQGALQKAFKISGFGDTLPVQTAKQWNPMKVTYRALLSPEEFKEIDDFIQFGARSKRVEALALNASQTGQVIITKGIMNEIRTRPVRALYLLGTDYLLARIYTSKAALRFFTQAVRLNPTSEKAIALFTKAIQIAYSENVEDFEEKLGEQGVP